MAMFYSRKKGWLSELDSVNNPFWAVFKSDALHMNTADLQQVINGWPEGTCERLDAEIVATRGDYQ